MTEIKIGNVNDIKQDIETVAKTEFKMHKEKYHGDNENEHS